MEQPSGLSLVFGHSGLNPSGNVPEIKLGQQIVDTWDKVVSFEDI